MSLITVGYIAVVAMLALIMIGASVFFWTLFEQAGSSLTLFAERNTDLTVAGGFAITAGQTQFFNAFFIVALAPLFSILTSNSAACAGIAINRAPAHSTRVVKRVMIELRLHDCLQRAAFIVLQTNPTPLRNRLVALAQVGARDCEGSYVSVVMAGFIPAIHVFSASFIRRGCPGQARA